MKLKDIFNEILESEIIQIQSRSSLCLMCIRESAPTINKAVFQIHSRSFAPKLAIYEFEGFLFYVACLADLPLFMGT